jgi:predicted RND superfamily exporter protein
MLNWVENWWEKNTEFSARVDGQTAMFAHMQHDVTDTLIKSITIAIVAVSLMMLLIFRNVKLLPLFVLPNILPIALVVGIMGWVGIDIDIGVAISGAIIIGVAVDDSIHFLVKYFEARDKGANIQDSLTYVMQYAGNAIIFTTIILSIAFSVFVFSDFLPNYMFGIVTASALIIAVVADFLMLPAILSMIDTYKAKRRRVI